MTVRVRQFPLQATEIFVRWLESECGPNVREGIADVIAAEREDVGRRIEKQLIKTRHYHGTQEIDLQDADVLTANRVLSIVRAESGIAQRKG